MHDYARSVQHKKHSQKQKKGKPSLPKKLLFATLLLIAAAAFGLYKLTQVEPEEPVATPTPAKKKAPPAPKEVPAAKEEYDFYSLLPESEVVAPKVEAYASGEKDASKQNYAYMIQAGSFRSAEEADKLRATLLLEGLNVTTSKVTNHNGSTWHRVMVGPFTSRSKLNSAQDTLARANTEGLVLKVKK